MDRHQLKRGLVSAGPNVDLLCVWQLDAAAFCGNYAKFYFDAKYLEEKRDCIGGDGIFVHFLSKKCPFWSILNAVLNF